MHPLARVNRESAMYIITKRAARLVRVRETERTTRQRMSFDKCDAVSDNWAASCVSIAEPRLVAKGVSRVRESRACHYFDTIFVSTQHTTAVGPNARPTSIGRATQTGLTNSRKQQHTLLSTGQYQAHIPSASDKNRYSRKCQCTHYIAVKNH